MKHRTAIAGGKSRRKFTAFDMATTPPTLIRRDYALADLRKLGGKLPGMSFDNWATCGTRRTNWLWPGRVAHRVPIRLAYAPAVR